MLSTVQLYIYSILGMASFVSGIVLLLAYWRIKGLREAPGILVLWQCFAQTVLDVHWAYVAINYWAIGEEPSEIVCEINGLVCIYFYFLTLSYNSCLSTEVLLKIKNPVNCGYKKRSSIYHALCHFISTGIMMTMAVSNTAGHSFIGTCFVKESTWAEYLMAVPLATFYPFSFTVIVIAFWTIYKTEVQLLKRFLLKHVFFLVVFMVFFMPFSLSIFMRELESGSLEALRVFSYIMGSASGLAINSVRLSDRAFKKYVARRLGSQGRSFTRGISMAENLISRNDSIYESSYTELFNSMQHKVVMSSLLGLEVVFRGTETAEFMELEIVPPWNSDYYTKQTCVLSMNTEDLSELNQETKEFMAKSRIKVTERAPLVFKHIRLLENITHEELSNSFSLMKNLGSILNNIGNKGGRSSAFFYHTFDNKLIVKTISKEEESVLLKYLLPSYHKHLYLCRSSLLSRIIGLFQVEISGSTTISLLVMKNIFEKPLDLVFDLKGSRIARQSIHHEDCTQLVNDRVYKDLDFLKYQKTLNLSYQDSLKLKRIVNDDVNLLASLNIMDYSLLVGFASSHCNSSFYFQGASDSPKGYYIGIIDFLQTYNTLKKVESFGKSIVRPGKKSQISVINSADYASRFLKFIVSILPSN